jgi:hypothetical protein
MHSGARASDWHSDNPNVRPGLWIGSFIGAVVALIVIAGLVGRFVNGDGSPFLS